MANGLSIPRPHKMATDGTDAMKKITSAAVPNVAGLDLQTGGNSLGMGAARDRVAGVTSQGAEAGMRFTGTGERVHSGRAQNGLMMRRQMQDGGADARGNVSRYRDQGPVRREAAPGVGQGQEIQGVSGRLNTLLQSDSPYLERARHRGRQVANRRGLLNSSMAAGASEAAAIDAALPIASADADISARERAMRSQEYQQARDHRVQQLMQQRGLDHTSAENQADRELSERMQGRDITSREGMQQRDIDARKFMQQVDVRSRELMQQRGISHEAAQAQAERELRSTMQQRDLRVRQLMQDKGLSHDAAQRQTDRELTREQKAADRDLSKLLQERDHDVRKLMQSRQISHDAAMQEANRKHQSAIAAAERRAAAARQAAALSHASSEAAKSRATQLKIARDSAQRDINAEYGRQITAVTLNPNVPAEARKEHQDHLAFVRDESMKATGNVYNYKPTWTSARRPAEA